ncbi:MAG: WecB/TagA/CpsF family glycosyltransferase [Bacilli bacterium]|nr:WecB/TagA/CpsF family glycosyltransferase [Bacilli bacterium]
MRDYVTFLPFDALTMEEAVEEAVSKAKLPTPSLLVTPNLDGLRQTYKNPEVRQAVQSGDIITIDGKPVLWLAKLSKKKAFKNTVPGSDFTVHLLPRLEQEGLSVYFFGGKEGVAEQAAENVLKQYPNLKIAGTLCPEFGFQNNEELCKTYIDLINASDADVVLLCTGFPKSELFFTRHKDQFKKGLFMCVGATVDFLAGSVKRAPKWMSKIGLEWLYRLFHDFGRLFKRYWLDFWFLVKILFLMAFNKKAIEKRKPQGE